jgi:hypothetical protein
MRISTSPFPNWLARGALAGLLLLTACGDPNDAPAAAQPIATGPPATTPSTIPSTTAPESSLVEVVAVYERVAYYGACGNETATVDGVTYFPLFNEAYPRPDGAGRLLDLDRYPVPGAALGMRAAPTGALRVAPPGPGDDIGDMIVYADGIARFESDSGWVIWLTDDEQTYDWEC